MGKRILIGAVVLAAVFLAGFLPQYFQRTSVEAQLQHSLVVNREAHLRDLAAYACVQVSQKNFGLAAQTVSDFFGKLQEVAAGRADASSRKPLEDILASRDKITAELAKGDPAALEDLQAIYLKTRGATGL